MNKYDYGAEFAERPLGACNGNIPAFASGEQFRNEKNNCAGNVVLNPTQDAGKWPVLDEV